MTSFAQRVVLHLMPARAAAIEAETRAWRATCTGCGTSRDLWSLGGVRFRASGRRTLMGRCSTCGGLRKVVLEREAGPA